MPQKGMCLISPGWAKAHNEGRQPPKKAVESPVAGNTRTPWFGEEPVAKPSSQVKPSQPLVCH